VRVWDPATRTELIRLVTGTPVTALTHVPGTSTQPPLLVLGGTEGRMAAVALPSPSVVPGS
jgi:hypothetical protein